jgi:hypothetical protein
MKSILSKLLFSAVLVASAALVSAKEELPYSEGPVVEVSYIKVKPGMFDAYMKYLATTWKEMNAELKKADIILDAKVFSCTARNPREPDLILAVTYKNMAAMDNLEERSAPIQEKVWGSRQKSNDASIGREKMREVLGSELIRELSLK